MKNKNRNSLLISALVALICITIALISKDPIEQDYADNETEISITLKETKIPAESTEATIVEPFPIEDAKKALSVAMANRQSLDTFSEDGNTYDPSKFHNYSDASVNIIEFYKDGTWTVVDETTWKVEDAMLRLIEWDTYIKISTSISFGGDSYTLFDGEIFVGNKKHVESENELFTDHDFFTTPRDSEPYLTIPSYLLQ